MASSSSSVPSELKTGSRPLRVGGLSKSPTNVADAIFGFDNAASYSHNQILLPASSETTSTSTASMTTHSPLQHLRPKHNKHGKSPMPSIAESPAESLSETPATPQSWIASLPQPSRLPGDDTRRAFELERKHYPSFRTAVRSLPFEYRSAQYHGNQPNEPSVVLLVRKPYGAAPKTSPGSKLFASLSFSPHNDYKRSARVSNQATLEVAVLCRPHHPILILLGGTNGSLTVRYRTFPDEPLKQAELSAGNEPSLGSFSMDSMGTELSLNALLQEALLVRAQYAWSVTLTARALAQDPPPSTTTTVAAPPPQQPISLLEQASSRPSFYQRRSVVGTLVLWLLGTIMAAAVGFGAGLHLLEEYHQHQSPGGCPTTGECSVLWKPPHRNAFWQWILTEKFHWEDLRLANESDRRSTNY